ncbi:hypothetical protein C1A38_30470, partial [Verrucosispora sp. ts21]
MVSGSPRGPARPDGPPDQETLVRLQLTVADPSTAVIEYQVEAAPENTVGELAEALAARRPEPTGAPPAIFVAGA